MHKNRLRSFVRSFGRRQNPNDDKELLFMLQPTSVDYKVDLGWREGGPIIDFWINSDEGEREQGRTEQQKIKEISWSGVT